jgi:hypothetical protein
VLSLKLNDAAVAVLDGLHAIAPPGGLAPGLHDLAARGIVRRGAVLTWADSAGRAEGAPGIFTDLTGWECGDSSFHMEDFVPVNAAVADGAPLITHDDQRILLLHGIAFALEFSRLVYALQPSSPVRCILGANETNATFRFHQIRPGERWNVPGLDSYRMDKMIVLDIEPAE